MCQLALASFSFEQISGTERGGCGQNSQTLDVTQIVSLSEHRE